MSDLSLIEPTDIKTIQGNGYLYRTVVKKKLSETVVMVRPSQIELIFDRVHKITGEGRGPYFCQNWE